MSKKRNRKKLAVWPLVFGLLLGTFLLQRYSLLFFHGTICQVYPIVGYEQGGENTFLWDKNGLAKVLLQLSHFQIPYYQFYKEHPSYLQTEQKTGKQMVDSSYKTASISTAKPKKNAEEAVAAMKNTDISGVEYSLDKLSDFDFLVQNFFVVDSSTTVKKADLDAKVLMKKDLTMKQSNDKPQILIYHTHSQEAFADSVAGDVSTTIIGVGDYLTELLEGYGYQVIHNRDSYDLVNGVLDRSKAYDYAETAISQILQENPSIEVVLDLHRDGVNENTHLVTEINGKQTAQIMFFNGMSRLTDLGDIDYLYNPNREDNLAMSLQMKMKAEAYFPGFTRRIYLKAYEYNLHLRPKAMLIEAGAQTNTVQEELNAMEPLAQLLHMVLQ